MKKNDNILLAIILIIVNVVYAGWWHQVMVRPGIPKWAKTDMTISLVIILIASLIVFFTLASSRKKS